MFGLYLSSPPFGCRSALEFVGFFVQHPTGGEMVKRTLFVLALLLVAASAFAQTTATINGTVTTDGNPLPGVTVTISSPQMQGTRTTVTGEAGGYTFNGVPPGKYTVKFELQGMRSEEHTSELQSHSFI